MRGIIRCPFFYARKVKHGTTIFGGELPIDAQELKELLRETPKYISLHRAQVEKGGQGFEDNPTFSGFGPRYPMRPNFLENADLEASWLGDLMKMAVKNGAAPPLRFEPMYLEEHKNLDHTHSSWWGRTFWWVKGRCKGLSGGRMEEPEYGFFGRVSAGFGDDIQAIADHLSVWAPTVLRLERVDEVLERALKARKTSMRCFRNEAVDYIPLDVAAVKFGKSRRTLRNWVVTGTVSHIGEGYGAEISESSLKFRIDAIQSMRMNNLDIANAKLELRGESAG